MKFKFLKIPVYIHPTFWLFLLFFIGSFFGSPSLPGLILGVLVAGVVFFSILFHEYGHALTARRFGANVSIVLEFCGGKAEYHGVAMTRKQSFFITLNGPLFSAILILVSHLMLTSNLVDGYLYAVFYYARFLNIFWLAFNLLPVIPLDGGWLLTHLLGGKFGKSGERASLIIGVLVAFLVAPYCFYREWFIFGTLIALFGFQNFRLLQGGKHKRRRPTKASPYAQYLKGIEAIGKKDLEEAKTILKKLLKCKDTQIKHSAIESLAEVYFKEDEGKKSYDLLEQADHDKLRKGKCLLCKLAFKRKNYAVVGNYAREIYEIDPSYEIAILNSQAFGYLNRPSLAGAWFKTASAFESSDKEQLREVLLSAAYDLVRDQKAFKEHAGQEVLPLK